MPRNEPQPEESDQAVHRQERELEEVEVGGPLGDPVEAEVGGQVVQHGQSGLITQSLTRCFNRIMTCGP